MARDADDPSSLEKAIDEVAGAMTPRVVPDLRARVSERLNRPSLSVGWWRPAVACGVVLAALGWWLAPQAPREGNPTPAVVVRSTPAPSAPRAEAAKAPNRRPVPVAGLRALRRAQQAEDIAWEPAVSIEALAVEPLLIEGVAASTIEIDVPEIPELVVESLHVEPLPRSNP